MIIKSIAPTRLSLFGGGSDVPSFSNKNMGIVLNLAINLYQTIEYYTQEDSFQIASNEFPYNANPDFLYKVEKEFAEGVNHSGFHERRLISRSDALLESGLGASGAAVVALIGAINRAKNLNLTKDQIAEKAFEIESKFNYTGRQDAYASTFGGFNVMSFEADKVEIQPLALPLELLKSILLIYTGEPRSKNIQNGFKKLSNEQERVLKESREITLKSLEHLEDIEYIGKALDKSWELKRQANKGISNPKIENLYNKAKDLGAYGGKVCGSGGGGYMFFIVDHSKRDSFREFEVIDFEPDMNGLMTRII